MSKSRILMVPLTSTGESIGVSGRNVKTTLLLATPETYQESSISA